jgi:hypothetical protein
VRPNCRPSPVDALLRAVGLIDSQAACRALSEEARALDADPADRAELEALRAELDEFVPELPTD